MINSGGFNFGTIMNYKKTEGINEQAGANSFRKWTGMPQTVRANKKLQIPGLTTSKVVAEHRKKTVYPDVQSSLESSALGHAEPVAPARNISQSAWNKIRLVELKKRDRLNFNN